MKKFVRVISRMVPFAALIFGLLLSACSGGGDRKVVDTPTSGKIKVGVDHSFTLITEAQVFAFEALYPDAIIDTVFGNEADLINDFMNDSLPMIIVARKLTEEQEQYLKERQFNARTTKVAIDAITIILNKENPDSSLYFKTIKDILLGKITSWDQVNPANKLGGIRLVFDNLNSGIPRYFMEKFSVDSFPSTCSAANSNKELIDFVENNKNAIGVIGVNWVSDPNDTVSNSFLKRFRVAGISLEGDNMPGTRFYRPFQGYIAEGSYPFVREVYCINRQTYSGLAYGFSSFIAGEKGQYIILRSGMVPAAMPVRTVELKN